MRTRAGACASTMGAPFIRRRRAAMPRFPILARLLRRIAPARHRTGGHQTLQALAAECGPLAVSTLEHALAEPCQHSVAQALVAVRTFAESAGAPWLIVQLDGIAARVGRPLPDRVFDRRYRKVAGELAVLLDESRELLDLLRNVESVERLLRGLDSGAAESEGP